MVKCTENFIFCKRKLGKMHRKVNGNFCSVLYKIHWSFYYLKKTFIKIKKSDLNKKKITIIKPVRKINST